jgi:hypothetical protein
MRESAILGGIGRYMPIIDVHTRAHAYVTSKYGRPLPIPPKVAEILDFHSFEGRNKGNAPSSKPITQEVSYDHPTDGTRAPHRDPNIGAAIASVAPTALVAAAAVATAAAVTAAPVAAAPHPSPAPAVVEAEPAPVMPKAVAGKRR